MFMKMFSIRKIAHELISSFSRDECSKVEILLEKIIRKKYPNLNILEIEEIVEEIKDSVIRQLERYIKECHFKESIPKFVFSKSDPTILLGTSRILKADDNKTIEVKCRLLWVEEIQNVIYKLKPRDFEKLCAGIFPFVRKEIKLPDVKLNIETKDRKVDLYVETNFSGKPLLHIAQIKHKPTAVLSSDSLRFLSQIKLLLEKNNFIVIPYFFTSGKLSSIAWTDSIKFGIEVFDGEKIAIILAKNGIGFCNKEKTEFTFSENEFEKWLQKLQIKREKPSWITLI